MKLSIAEAVLDDLLLDSPQWPPEVRREAVQLGNEALAHYQEGRRLHGWFYFPLLPSETEEGD